MALCFWGGLTQHAKETPSASLSLALWNRELVKAGFAWWYRRYAPDDETLKQLEAEARAAKRGLWADPHVVPPWEWRGMRTRGRAQGRAAPAPLAEDRYKGHAGSGD